ncbi:dTDP-4-dehydrorhamnose 3,5-epimerase [Pseudomonadota bacterium]
MPFISRGFTLIEIIDTTLEGVCIVVPEVYEDSRGFFMETYNAVEFEKVGLPTEFLQDNHSRSSRGVLRGLHYQYPDWQGKLVRVLDGEIFDVAVDIRASSETYGQWFGTTLSSTNRHQLYIPPGFAHGFCVTSDTVDVAYKCTVVYQPRQDKCILWNDPDLDIRWPIDDPIVSEKDAKGSAFEALEVL